MPYGPPPGDGNPYGGAQPYGAPPPPAPGPPGYGYPSAPPPEPPYGAQPPGYGYPPPAPMDGQTCRFCGGYPAVRATVRGHQGLVLAYRMLRMHGPFCRTCGTATVRDMSARTLVQGWWSPASLILAPITLLMNLAANGRIKQLPPPMPGTHGPQLDPGVPLGRRPHMAMLLLPVSLAVTVILAATGVLSPKDDNNNANPGPTPTPVTTFSPTPLPVPTYTPPTFPSPTFTLPPLPSITLPPITTPSPRETNGVDDAKVGDCLRNENGTSETTDTDPKITVLPCTDSKAQYKVIYKYLATSDKKACEKQPKADSWYTSKHPNFPALDYVLCLKQLQ
ncbi:hypothetical protein ACH4E7_03650 [Kitasatospora sp. NPDC018058]|uniref:LppU/SCO3897 family protein n=1 Tax=Kitasatospora sp. NPDC018058 TaxID=3364025 RepID=UPI0037C05AA4